MNLIFTNMIINNTKFVDNISKFVNNGITIIKSSVVASNITVDYENKDFLTSRNVTVDSGFFNLNY